MMMAQATRAARAMRGTKAWGGLALIICCGCGQDPLQTDSEQSADPVAVGALRPGPVAPTVLATAPDQEYLGDVAVVNGQVLFSGGRTVPHTPGPPYEQLGVVRSVPAQGGTVQEVWSGAGGGSDIAAGGGGIYFLAYDYFSRTGWLDRIAAPGGAAVELGTWSSQGSTHSMAAEGQVAYWTHSAGAASYVLRTNSADGTTVTLADSSTSGGGADDILFKTGFVYWFSRIGVYGVAAAGGASFALYSSPQVAALGAAPSAEVLFAGVGGNLVGIETKGMFRTAVLVNGTDPIVAIAASDRAVYFGTWNVETATGAVSRLARTGAVTVIATGPIHPVAIAVDAASVYWADTLSMTVSRAPL